MNVGNNVGSRVGFLSPPDNVRLSRINGLSAACRECRDSRGEDPHSVARPTRAIDSTYSFCGT
jgi:hypothetical protein